ncbi:hypothetical protein K402DRAFT_451156 [Aulographum hederae CBS 113979]|uniref:BZIP domain-containing protein n=1 Tax=Aulographum hederae CBS 113979 TaxID=1176131 RepID=A0A6G1HD59_9PEZI|nr:hypothetical protein K402DRAFT_451156 [Aulographum hederae CBS 113979]
MPAPAQRKEDSLARVRDNQRRSRARRKEYLEELESKFRNCEQKGAEASAEIQVAARRVLDENRRLRSLLRLKGVSDAEVDDFNGCGNHDENQVPASAELNAMLGQRKPCRGGGEGCGTASMDISLAQRTPRPIESPYRTSAVEPAVAASDQASSGGRESTSGHAVTHGLLSGDSSSSESLHQIPYAVAFEAESPRITTYRGSFGADIPYQSQYFPGEVINVTRDYVAEGPASNHHEFATTSSCIHAASIIRSISTREGLEVEADLGCTAPGTDCKVNNSLVLSVMDRYSDTTANI